jgi:hypothetical protein
MQNLYNKIKGSFKKSPEELEKDRIKAELRTIVDAVRNSDYLKGKPAATKIRGKELKKFERDLNKHADSLIKAGKTSTEHLLDKVLKSMEGQVPVALEEEMRQKLIVAAETKEERNHRPK